MIKAVLFDLDNTLMDFMRMKRACVESAVDAMIIAGLQMPKRAATKALYDIYWNIGIEHPHIFEEFLKKVHRKIDYRILAAGIVAYRKTQLGYQRPFPGISHLLISLRERGLRLVIVSDAPRLKAWLRLTELGMQDFFDNVVAFEDTGHRKPSPLPFRKALRHLRLKPSEVVMVGDWPARDIAGAKALGITTVWARYGWQFAKPAPIRHGADYVIDAPLELLRVLQRNKT
jgi:HAD superfamily hydrolase (TIGR02253 family)